MKFEELKSLSYEELAKMRTAIPRNLDTETLCDWEFARRERISQHELNKSLLHITVIATISATILGAIVVGVMQFAFK